MPNIAVVWDFDGTLSPQDSTTATAEFLTESSGEAFWETVHKIKGTSRRSTASAEKREALWRQLLASDAPIWMYTLSRFAFARQVPLNQEFLGTFIKPRIGLYPKVPAFFRKLKLLEENTLFRTTETKIFFFIVSAGLQDLVSQVLPADLIEATFGCRYEVIAHNGDHKRPESVPVFCMDETMKTRSLFEISKGSFRDDKFSVNRYVAPPDRWAPFENMIYVGDGDTDIPSLSLVRNNGGLGIVVYNPNTTKEKLDKKLKHMRLDKRADLITEANFDQNAELFEFIQSRCKQIALRTRAEIAL